jgi:hypothetical protein
MSCSMENLDDTEHNPEFFEDERYVFTFMKLNWKHGLLFSSLLQNWESYVHNSLKSFAQHHLCLCQSFWPLTLYNRRDGILKLAKLYLEIKPFFFYFMVKLYIFEL